MKFFRARPAASMTRDEGMTLVEVMVAMLIFAIVSVGVIYTMLSVMTIGRDSRARQVATNLAAEAVDRAREEENVFELLDGEYQRELNGDTFTVTRTTAWVSDPGADFTCGAGGAGGAGDPLRYKRVNIEVTWENMRSGSIPARSDTIIDPKNRINDPTKGTLLISVLNGEGTGNPGVSVTAQRTDNAGNPIGGALPAVTTDAQGCAYILRAEPGDYRVAINKAGNTDINNVSSPSQSTGAQAGATGSVAFTYDQRSTLRLTYASGENPAPRVAPGDQMPTTFVSTYGNFTESGNGSNPRAFTLFPFGSGYDVLAGRYLPYRENEAGNALPNCLSPDPAEWEDGERDAAVPATPGATVNGEVRMGVVQIDAGSGGRYVKAVAVGSPPEDTGDPGCQETYEFRFANNTLDSSGKATIALPFGTWELYRGNSNTPTRIQGSQITPLTEGTVNSSGSSATVTMDPRS